MSFTNLKEALHHWWEVEYVLHLTEQSDELFANFIQEAALDRSACSSHSLLFWSNLFNYISFCLIFDIDSFFEGITNIMTEQYILLEPFYIHSINSIISAQKHIFPNRLGLTKARRFFEESCSIKLVSENIFRRVFLFFSDEWYGL